MNCKLCGDIMEEYECRNVNMTEDIVNYMCDSCGRVFSYRIPTRGCD